MTAEPNVDTGDLYLALHERFLATIVRAEAEGRLDTIVPATPDWSVRDALAHVTGLTADLNAARFPAADDPGGNRFTARQVETRRGRPVAEVAAEWRREAPAFADGLRLFGYETGSHFVADLHAHHQDVRGALGRERDDDPVTVAVSLDHYLGFVEEVVAGAGWGTLEITAGATSRLLGGSGSHHATLDADRFELLRGLSARRSLAQIRALRWSGDVDSLLALLAEAFVGNYEFRQTDLLE